MIDISSAKVVKAIAHKVGNKLREEGYVLSSEEMIVDAKMSELMLRCYLGGLVKVGEPYSFVHESDLSLNEVYKFSNEMFDDANKFASCSKSIAKHLYGVSMHTKISGGEVIMVLFDKIIFDNNECQGLCVVKVEAKSSYLDVSTDAGFDGFQLIERNGISVDNIQKGALIISGKNYSFTIDKISKAARYWMDLFLKVSPIRTSKICGKTGGEFVKNVLDKLGDPNDKIAFGNYVENAINQGEVTSIKELKKGALQFLDGEVVESVVEKIKTASGFEVEDEMKIETSSLYKFSKKAVNSVKVLDGINLSVNDGKIKVLKIDAQKSGGRILLVADFEIKE